MMFSTHQIIQNNLLISKSLIYSHLENSHLGHHSARYTQEIKFLRNLEIEPESVLLPSFVCILF